MSKELTEKEKKIRDSFKVEVGEGFARMTLTFERKLLKEVKVEKRG